MVLLAFAESAPVQLIPDGTLFIHIALILLMIWILNRTFFRPINHIISSREKNKGGRSSEAESLLREVSAKETQYNESLREARSKTSKCLMGGWHEFGALSNGPVDQGRSTGNNC